MAEPKLPVLEESPWADEVHCALCTRPGHVARFCPYTVAGRLRQQKAEAAKRFTIAFAEDA